MHQRTVWLILLASAAIIGALAACQSAPPETIIKEVVVTQIVEVERTVLVESTPQVVVEERLVTPEARATPAGDFGAFPVLRVAMLSDIATTNIWNHVGPQSTVWTSYVIDGYYPSLFKVAMPRNDYVPELALGFASPLVEENGAWVSTVQLRRDVFWSDGVPVTARDVALTANTALELRLTGNWPGIFDPAYLARVEVVDDYTARFVYVQPPGLARHEYGALLGLIVPAHFWEPVVAPLRAAAATIDATTESAESQFEALRLELYAADATGEPSAGGFVFGQWEPGAFIENVANEAYSLRGETTTLYANGAYKHVAADGTVFSAYGEPTGDVVQESAEGPNAQSVIYSVLSQDAAMLALANGDVDIIYNSLGLQPGQADIVKKNRDVEVITNPANGFRYLGFNFAKRPLDDAALRRAIDCVIDKQLLTDGILQGSAMPVYTAVPQGNTFWYNPDVTIHCEEMTGEERFAEAVAILKAAGYSWAVEPAWNDARGGSIDRGTVLLLPDGGEFPEMKLLAPSAGYDPLRATAGVFIEQFMQDLGIPVRAELTNFNNVVNAVFGRGDWDMFVLGWGLNSFPNHLCDFFATGAGYNVLNYSNRTLDATCQQFQAATDIATARTLAYELQEILAVDLPYVFLFTTPVRDAYDTSRLQFDYTDVLGGISGMQQTTVRGLSVAE